MKPKKPEYEGVSIEYLVWQDNLAFLKEPGDYPRESGMKDADVDWTTAFEVGLERVLSSRFPGADIYVWSRCGIATDCIDVSSSDDDNDLDQETIDEIVSEVKSLAFRLEEDLWEYDGYAEELLSSAKAAETARQQQTEDHNA